MENRDCWFTIRMEPAQRAALGAAAQAAGLTASDYVRRRLADVLATTPATPAPPSSARPATQTGG